jgi:hypothetical protein
VVRVENQQHGISSSVAHQIYAHTDGGGTADRLSPAEATA